MKKRINKKLTTKQAKIIKIIILAAFITLYLTLTITGVIVSTCEENIKYLFVYLSIVSSGVLLAVLKIVLDTTLKRITEPQIHTEGKKVVLDFLNKEMFTELFFIPQNNSEVEMFLNIIQIEGYRFFAKLNESNDDIILIVKNPQDNEIFRCEILNYSYFNARFKPKK